MPLAEAVAALSLKDLRALIGEAGLSTDGCIDKSDLRSRATEAATRLKAPGAKLGPVSKPLISDLIAEELGIFDTEEDKARKVAEAGAAVKAKIDAAAATYAGEEAAQAEKEAQKERAAAENRAAAKAADKEKKEAEKKEKQRVAKAAALVRASEGAEAAALIEAVKSGDVDLLTAALGKTTSVDAREESEQEYTALHMATSKGDAAMVDALLAAGANASATDAEVRGPLHIAAMFNRVEACKALLAHGADVFAADANAQTARKYAELNGRAEIVALIAEAQATSDEKSRAEAEVTDAAAAEAAAAAAQQAVAEGLVQQQVRISGLKARPELNGLVGYVLAATENGRCTVAVKVGEVLEQIALKPTNLEHAS